METFPKVDYWLLSHGELLSINITPETMEKLFVIGNGEVDCNEVMQTDDVFGGFICTRNKGHSGPHIAVSKDDVCALWPQK